MLRLRSDTDAGWAARMLPHLDDILLDHAHLEKKAAGTALTLLFRYPEQASLQQPLSELAREELRHFEAMLAVLARRGLRFGRHRPGPYAGKLRAAVRRDDPERLIDMLLCSALIEARSCERLGLLAEALATREATGVGAVSAPADLGGLASLYRGLHEAEARHHRIYVELACKLAPEAGIRARLEELAAHEAEALRLGAGLARLHGDMAEAEKTPDSVLNER